ncbi:hypothetical protein IMG5_195720 [Ichthyophthirius multifiliis]|uniref:Uncharacterized protein n=1 Tax=Ichthyophthirius multifiliis TaxID=5932 RepID=G0R4Z7_ICHMU|nr:hypothetical protein IMG5_195720 [Ichthyophthirius multifiliis]EGR27460.1 hypothetical protein IMG5_195720 [Ichthyophthirius multifiliis]|eukprot:XP_004024370.1 hypothetical protein IMG5_195720 [Ichthyophthirius multifiliis]
MTFLNQKKNICIFVFYQKIILQIYYIYLKMSKCPFSNQQKCQFSDQQKQILNVKNSFQKLTKSQINQSKCPFVENEKPQIGLIDIPEKYQIYYISNYDHLLQEKNMQMSFNLDKILEKQIQISQNRIIFEQIPIFLKHTLFFDYSNLKKIQQNDVYERFFIYKNLKEKGNEKFISKEYSKALYYYEHALSIYKWLEIKDKQYNNEDEEEYILKEDYELEDEQINQKYKLLVKQQKQKTIIQIYIYKIYIFIYIYILFYFIYYIQQKSLHNLMTKIQLQKMVRKQQIQNNKKLESNYQKAYTIQLEILKINENSSLAYLRIAQCKLSNKKSTYKDLLEAKQILEKSFLLRENDEIFSNQNSFIRKILGLDNYVSFWEKIQNQLQEKILLKIQTETYFFKEIFERVEELQEIEKEMIQQGKIVQNNIIFDLKQSEKTIEEDLILIIKSKYYLLYSGSFFDKNKKTNKNYKKLKKYIIKCSFL